MSLRSCRNIGSCRSPIWITSTVKKPLAAHDQAIRAKDGNQFSAAYGQLTASCNTCHQTYDRAVIVIQPSTVGAFPDQDFSPVQRQLSRPVCDN
jgi:hypothetical protein